MSSDHKPDQRLARLQQQLRFAPTVTPDLVFEVAASVCTRLPVLAKASHVDRLIAAGAWTDVAFALIEIELPAWKLRRLVHEDGEWFCSLSKELNLPLAIDDTADAQHELLPLAILGAFVEARRRSCVAADNRSPSVPHILPASATAVCCDNFV